MGAVSLFLPDWDETFRPSRGEGQGRRARSALAAALVHALLGYALVAGLGYPPILAVDEPLKLFDVLPEPVPPPAAAEAPAPRVRPDRPEGAAAPPNLEARPKPIVAPTPRIRIEIAEQLGAAPIAGTGPDSSAGASAMSGPGTGAGGAGSGTGSGGAGRGTGSGGGIAAPARHVAGRLHDPDYPRGAYRDRVEGEVTARLTVGADGRVTRCVVTRSSGHAELDSATCRLIERRFRYEPARNADGDPVVSEVGWRQSWWLEPR